MVEEAFIPRENRGFRFVRMCYDWLEAGVVAVLCVALVFTFVARTVEVFGASMLPTLENGDRLLATTCYREPQPGDIVVVVQPNTLNQLLIKRVIAVGGQTVDIDARTGGVLVDGTLLEEPYIAEPIASVEGLALPQQVPEGHLFVLGDNRNHSWDSRAAEVGMVDARYVLGKAVFRVLPYDRSGLLDGDADEQE